jgi:hypothetical protein
VLCSDHCDIQITVERFVNGEGWCSLQGLSASLANRSRRRFERNFRGEVVEHMQKEYPFLRDPKNLEMFKKKWLYMFVYAEVGYARAYTSLHHFVLARPVSPDRFLLALLMAYTSGKCVRAMLVAHWAVSDGIVSKCGVLGTHCIITVFQLRIR